MSKQLKHHHWIALSDTWKARRRNVLGVGFPPRERFECMNELHRSFRKRQFFWSLEAGVIASFHSSLAWHSHLFDTNNIHRTTNGLVFAPRIKLRTHSIRHRRMIFYYLDLIRNNYYTFLAVCFSRRETNFRMPRRFERSSPTPSLLPEQTRTYHDHRRIR